MASILPVRFSYAARDLWFDPGLTGAQEGDHVICATERGTEIGLATSSVREVSAHELAKKTNNAQLKPVLRVATETDLARAEDLARRGDEALPVFRRHVVESGLDMKPVGVEYLFGRERVVCYFAADERVDFRQLVRSLSHELHERIDMRQIGVREEAAVVGGFGHCGQELCCARIGLSFEPVSIRMAKEQDLPLTSNKISGACGRLMCCLRYEFEAYRDFKGRAPKRNAVIDTPLGKAKIVEYDTPKEQLALRLENGKSVRIPLAEMIASDAAVKKSEELHCPCRPDTVLRESLDKLSSPEVQMALAELDRKMGVVPEEDFDSSDIFVEPKPKKRRNRRRSSSNASEAQAPQPSAKPSRRRRRHAAKQGASEKEQPVQETPQKSSEAPSDKRSRRRRRKRSGSGTAATATQNVVSTPPVSAGASQAQGSGEAPKENKTRRRRRHRSAGSGQTSVQPRQERPANQEKSTKQERFAKPKRRPGDRAGLNGQAQGHRDAADAGQDKAPARRRRRRRGGRGRGGQDASAQSQSPQNE